MAKKIAPKAPVANIKKRVSSKPYIGNETLKQANKVKELQTKLNSESVAKVEQKIEKPKVRK